MISGIVVVVFLVIIIYAAINNPSTRSRRIPGRGARRVTKAPTHGKVTASPDPKAQGKRLRPAGTKSSLSELEDRENDWLAREIAREAQTDNEFISEMKKLKLEHMKQHNSIHRGARGMR